MAPDGSVRRSKAFAREETSLTTASLDRMIRTRRTGEMPLPPEPGAVTGNSLTLRIISTSVLIFLCYFTIGLQLAVVPGFVHWQLGYNAVLAGLAISAQYVATLASRPLAGRMGDSVGAKHTTCSGLLVGATSGLVLVVSACLQGYPWASFCVLLLSRLTLGIGESWVATGATIWGLGRVGATFTAQVISWSGIASYGALAIGAPVGVWLENSFGLGAIGLVSVAGALGGF